LELNNFWDFIEQIGNRATFKPHRLLMLLAVIDLLEEEPVNRIYFDERLKKNLLSISMNMVHPVTATDHIHHFFIYSLQAFGFYNQKKGGRRFSTR
jgi:hypothetical protein